MEQGNDTQTKTVMYCYNVCLQHSVTLSFQNVHMTEFNEYINTMMEFTHTSN